MAENGQRPTEAFREEHRHLVAHVDQIRAAGGEVVDLAPEEREALVGRILEFLRKTLVPHAEWEEQVLYAAVGKLLGNTAATATMSRDHVAIRRMIDALAEADPSNVTRLQELLYGLHALILVHFETEEEVYLPLLDTQPYRDRADAGRALASRLQGLVDERPVVVGLPRGGVPVAYEVAAALGAPLDIVVVRKLGAPLHAELGMGAVGEGGVRVVNEEVVRALGVTPEEFEEVSAREQAELERRTALYRGDRSPVPVEGRTVILVDDGIATGFTAIAGARAHRSRGAARVVLAVPVGPPGAAGRFAGEVDEFVCLDAPEWFFAVGACYEHFGQTGDDEVRTLLERAHGIAGAEDHAARRQPRAVGARPVGGVDWNQVRHRDVDIPAGRARHAGDLRLPPVSAGLVIFAHGSGSSRLSPRNMQVAAALTAAGFATLLFDLLTEAEAQDRRNVFDIALLAERLAAATRWARQDAELHPLPLGYFGASTGAGGGRGGAPPGNSDNTPGG